MCSLHKHCKAPWLRKSSANLILLKKTPLPFLTRLLPEQSQKFPAGISLLEGGRAELSPLPGTEEISQSEDLPEEFGLTMATAVPGKLSQLSITVSSAEVPPVFWKPYIHGGYRPLRRSWRLPLALPAAQRGPQHLVLFFLVAAFFFSHPYPEKWFPGKCHFFGQSHQIFHVFLVLCTLAQIEAVVLDYESRREIYSSLQQDLAYDFSALFLATVTCSVLTATYMAQRVKNKLGLKEE